MKKSIFIFIIELSIIYIFVSCDCNQKASGIVLDKMTKKPIDNVSIDKYEKADTNKLSSRLILTDETGQFSYHNISGGLCGCPDVEIYFNKDGYKETKMTLKSFSENDTIYLERL